MVRNKIVRVMCFVSLNYAKLCVFYWVLICLKVVIKNQVEDTKFAQEKHFFSMYLNSNFNLKLPRYLSIEARNLLPSQHSSTPHWYIELRRLAKIGNVKKPIIYSFETQIEIRLNRYLKNITSHLLESFLEREKHSIYASRVL